MLFKGQFATQMSGSVNGLTASRGRGGSYFRDRALPVNPSTPFQQEIRALFGSLASRWVTGLTQVQRATWDLYASSVEKTNRIGDPHFNTGLDWYIAMNVRREQAGLTRVDTAPGFFNLGILTEPVIDSIDSVAGTMDVSFDNTDGWAVEDEGALMVYISRPVNESINFFKGPYRLAATILGDGITPPTSPVVVTLPFPVIVGQKLFVRFAGVRFDGRLTNEFRSGLAVTV